MTRKEAIKFLQNLVQSIETLDANGIIGGKTCYISEKGIEAFKMAIVDMKLMDRVNKNEEV